MGKFSRAEAERIEDATLSLSVSASLKDRIDDAAKMENVSVDTWALRVMEEALKPAPAATYGPNVPVSTIFLGPTRAKCNHSHILIKID